MHTGKSLVDLRALGRHGKRVGIFHFFSIFFSRTKEVASEGPSKISRQNYWQELVSLQAGLSASFWNVHGQRKL